MKTRVLVTGAGGFIGHHLVKRLKADGYWVRGVDIKGCAFEPSPADEFLKLDLRDLQSCFKACAGMEDVYQLAADMGGIGYITTHLANVARNNILINVNMLESSRLEQVRRYLYTSSACIYPQHLQRDITAGTLRLKEEDAYPADPEPGYGWEKLFAEQMCGYYQNDFGLNIRIVRFHNIYGPLGTWTGGKEKSPAAICRKVAQAKNGDSIEIWGDGQQTRSYMYIDDCIEGVRRVMESRYQCPFNLGTDELVSISQLVDLVCQISGKHLLKQYDITKPQGVRGRNSDNSRLQNAIHWSPAVSLAEGMKKTYEWINKQVH